jgi:hypothetical protein
VPQSDNCTRGRILVLTLLPETLFPAAGACKLSGHVYDDNSISLKTPFYTRTQLFWVFDEDALRSQRPSYHVKPDLPEFACHAAIFMLTISHYPPCSVVRYDSYVRRAESEGCLDLSDVEACRAIAAEQENRVIRAGEFCGYRS